MKLANAFGKKLRRENQKRWAQHLKQHVDWILPPGIICEIEEWHLGAEPLFEGVLVWLRIKCVFSGSYGAEYGIEFKPPHIPSEDEIHSAISKIERFRNDIYANTSDSPASPAQT